MSINSSEKLLYSFVDQSSTANWQIVNDGVMGGLSTSSIEWNDNQVAVFSGEVSLENNGGFASVRTRPQDFGIEQSGGIKLRIKGDGKRYKFRLRTNANFDGVVYSADFGTKDGNWEVVAIPFGQFRPTFRGRILNNVKPLTPADIQQVGLLISDKQAGFFSLEIDWIKAY